jgi:diaminobutyrate-2-oxoglutarate transaminase
MSTVRNGKGGKKIVSVFERRESEVRSYSRAFPVVFERASGPFMYDTKGRRYIDFFCGAGSLNYGHNPPEMIRAIQEYLGRDGVMHTLDMWTTAKRSFLETFERVILRPRNMDYKVQFTGPTGANSVEAALKLARKATGRSNVIAFARGYHGLSAGALSITANSYYRDERFVNRLNVSFMPYDGYLGADLDTLQYIRRFVEDESSGVDLPAAIVVETVQAEGGVHVARAEWLQQLESLCREFHILLIVDDIQVGCGRAGTFFSFERAGIYPDIVLLSKSISGIGLPMAIALIRPEIDVWKPGEHTGTFRGNNLAFIAATEALQYWATAEFSRQIAARSNLVRKKLQAIADDYPEAAPKIRGLGMIFGLQLEGDGLARRASKAAFRDGLIMELCGSGNVLKLLPPLVIEEAVLEEGLEVVRKSIGEALAKPSTSRSEQRVLRAKVARPD